MGGVAFISDIHGNWEALEKTLERLESLGTDEIHCLGDMVGYGPDPEKCLDEVAKRCSMVVAGNHDWAAVGKTPLEDFNVLARAAIYWTRERLSPSQTEYLATLPLTLPLPSSILLVHSSPVMPHQWPYLMDEFSARVALEGCREKLVMVGHTHIPLAYRMEGGTIKAIPFPFAIEGEARYLVNAGSVGQPRDGDPRACCIFMEGGWVRLERVPYPAHVTAEKIKDRGLPPLLAMRIQEGW